MPKFDLTITISVILAICAIISPIITSIIDNYYQLKFKKIDLHQKHIENTILYKRHIFESYLKYAGRCVYFSDSDARKEYGEYYFLALSYVPENLSDKMIAINREIINSDLNNAIALFESLTVDMHTMLQNM